MMILKWKRTVIGGQTCHNDFIAYTDWGDFCRIIRNNFSPSAGMWQWALVMPICPFQKLPYGSCDSKDEVVDLVKRMFEVLRDSKQLEFNRPFTWEGGYWYK